MVYGADTKIPVEVNTLTWKRMRFEENPNKEHLDNEFDFPDEIRDTMYIREVAAK